MTIALGRSRFTEPIVLRVGRERRARDAAERRAAADEPEQALGLPRVVHDVGERPELADEQDAEDQRRQM